MVWRRMGHSRAFIRGGDWDGRRISLRRRSSLLAMARAGLRDMVWLLMGDMLRSEGTCGYAIVDPDCAEKVIGNILFGLFQSLQI